MSDPLMQRLTAGLPARLAAVNQFASTIRAGLAGPVTTLQEELLDEILDRSEDLLWSLDDLHYARRLHTDSIRAERTACDLGQLLRQVHAKVARRARGRNVGIALCIENPLPKAFCDAELTDRAITNLVLNAIEFAPQDSPIRLSANAAGEHLEVSVTDNGPTIHRQPLETLLEQHRQIPLDEHQHPASQSLAIAFALVELNGGRIELKSNPEQGNGFVVELLRYAEQARVLVIDNDGGHQRLRDHLQVAGYDVITSSTADEAVNQATTRRPDAIVLDQSAAATTGLATLDRLKQCSQTRDTPIIVLSASLRDQQKALERGAQWLVPVPCDGEAVITAVQSSLQTT